MGGGMTHLRSFIQELSRDSRDCEYLFIIDHHFPDEISVPWIKTRRVDFSGIKGLTRFVWEEIKLPRLFSQYRADILISLLNFGPLLANIPQIVFERNPIYFSKEYYLKLSFIKKGPFLFRRFLTLKTMLNSLKVVTPSVAMKNMIQEVYPQLDSKRFAVLPHGFAAESFHQKSAESDSSRLNHRGKDKGFTRILFVSHLASHKGFEVAIKAINELKKMKIQAKLYLTVDRTDSPKVYDKLVLLMRESGIEEQVVVLGTLAHKELSLLYQESDIFFFPSWCESFGYPMMEAMASGLPIVAADTPVNREICQRSARYFLTENPRSAAQCLEAVIKEPGIQTNLIEEGQKVIKNYPSSWKNYVDTLIELSKNAIQQKKSVLSEVQS